MPPKQWSTGALQPQPKQSFNKMNQAEKAARLKQRAMNLIYQSTKQKIDFMLSKRPDQLENSLNHLQDLLPLFWTPELEAEFEEWSTSMTGVKRKASSESLTTPPEKTGRPASSDALSVSDETASLTSPIFASIPTYIPKCNTDWFMVKPAILQWLLHSIEPSSLSTAAQRALCPINSKGVQGKHIPKAALQQLLEFSCGVKAGDNIEVEMKEIEYCIYVLSKTYEKRGKPAAGICLPVDWNAFGVYSMIKGSEEDGGRFILYNKITGEVGDIPADYDDALYNDQISPTFEKNWSMTHAEFCLSPSLRYMCIISFPKSEVKVKPDNVMSYSDWCVFVRGFPPSLDSKFVQVADQEGAPLVEEGADFKSEVDAMASSSVVAEGNMLPPAPGGKSS